MIVLAEYVAQTLIYKWCVPTVVLVGEQLGDADTGECLQVFRGHFNQIYEMGGSVVYTVLYHVWACEMHIPGMLTGKSLFTLASSLKFTFTDTLKGRISLVWSSQLTVVAGRAEGRVLGFALPDLNQAHRNQSIEALVDVCCCRLRSKSKNGVLY
jgi:hypothetical protein